MWAFCCFRSNSHECLWKTLTIGSNGGVQTRTNKKKLSQKSTHTRTLTMCVVEYYSAVHLVAVELAVAAGGGVGIRTIC